MRITRQERAVHTVRVWWAHAVSSPGAGPRSAGVAAAVVLDRWGTLRNRECEAEVDQSGVEVAGTRVEHTATGCAPPGCFTAMCGATALPLLWVPDAGRPRRLAYCSPSAPADRTLPQAWRCSSKRRWATSEVKTNVGGTGNALHGAVLAWVRESPRSSAGDLHRRPAPVLHQ